MKYKNVVKARFLSRPNRFIAYAELDGREVVAHVKNTGRCRELLTPNAEIILSKAENPDARTLTALQPRITFRSKARNTPGCPEAAIAKAVRKLSGPSLSTSSKGS